MDELTLRLPSKLREQLEAEAEQRGIPVGEHICEIVETHCRGTDGLDRPDIEVQYAHTVAKTRPGARQHDDADGDSSTTQLASFSYGSRSILS